MGRGLRWHCSRSGKLCLDGNESLQNFVIGRMWSGAAGSRQLLEAFL